MATPCTLERAAAILGGLDAAGDPAPISDAAMRRVLSQAWARIEAAAEQGEDVG